jgi:hypothetical protein
MNSLSTVAATRQSAAIPACISHRRFAKRHYAGGAALIYFCFLLSAFTFRASAQNYSINWYKIAGGGGISTGGTYQVSGTIGQPDASGAMNGGNYSVTGGFWSLFAVQTLGAPLLTITYIGNQAIVSWSPSATGWALQTNANLATPTWGNYLGPVVNNSTTNSPPKGTVFFRLTHP